MRSGVCCGLRKKVGKVGKKKEKTRVMKSCPILLGWTLPSLPSLPSLRSVLFFQIELSCTLTHTHKNTRTRVLQVHFIDVVRDNFPMVGVKAEGLTRLQGPMQVQEVGKCSLWGNKTTKNFVLSFFLLFHLFQLLLVFIGVLFFYMLPTLRSKT